MQAPFIHEGLTAVQLNLAASKLRIGREQEAIKHAESVGTQELATSLSRPACNCLPVSIVGPKNVSSAAYCIKTEIRFGSLFCFVILLISVLLVAWAAYTKLSMYL